MPLRSDIIGVVLAGGASSRMGTDKALLPLGGAPIITYAAKALSSVFSEVVVSSGSGKRYAFLGGFFKQTFYIHGHFVMVSRDSDNDGVELC